MDKHRPRKLINIAKLGKYTVYSPISKKHAWVCLIKWIISKMLNKLIKG